MSTKVRILEIITLGEIGGAQNVFADLVQGITEYGRNVEIDIVFGKGDYLKEIFAGWPFGEVIQIPFMARNLNLSADLKVLFFLKRLCKERKYDIVHCHSSKASFLARVAARWAGVPRICMTVHGLPFHQGISPVESAVYRAVEKLAFPLASEYIFVSRADIKEALELGLHENKVKFIPNGRPIPKKPMQGLRQKYGIPRERPIVCMAARLSPVKNPMFFLRVAKRVLLKIQEGCKPVFILIGDGPMMQQCLDFVKGTGLERDILLTGEIKEAAAHFWDADVGVLTSEYEACPLVLIEAMATGTPVVAPDVGGISGIVQKDRTGFLYPAGNEEEAAACLIKLLKDEKLRREMKKAALQRYYAEFTVQKMIEGYMSIFDLTGA
ncbi:group 1 glycosyl transferase [Thermincola ferriacetica]|uniref:Group 1 glycosyl transferase n=1 Tax=Thermincola ferriacetica TaxID=281456 RepID=A0A0L6W3B4_9FIRM|nr:glycosyltransferase family 4 protein [Thermincola ferriacetica]KNZ70025.1 group 1 glycosyl transferase [Thermincola ferriacetica]